MKVLKMEVGMLGTNCYIAVNEATGHGVVVDPGGDSLVSECIATPLT